MTSSDYENHFRSVKSKDVLSNASGICLTNSESALVELFSSQKKESCSAFHTVILTVTETNASGKSTFKIN